MMKYIKLFVFMSIFMFVMSSCVEVPVDQVEKITVSGINIQGSYEIGSTVSLAGAKVSVFYEGNSTTTPNLELSISDSDVTLSGTGFLSAGSGLPMRLNTSNITSYFIRVSYGGVSITINYNVVLDENSQTVLDMIDDFDGSIDQIEAIDQAYQALTIENSITYLLENSNIQDFLMFYDGDGSEDDPYLISNWYQLSNVRTVLSGNYHFELINDIDQNSFGYNLFASATANGNLGWEPIGYADAISHENDAVITDGEAFRGDFDGQGFVITDLIINRPGEDFVGLFGVIRESWIHDIHLENADVQGNDYVGGLAGWLDENLSSDDVIQFELSDSSSDGMIVGQNYVGGLIGYLKERVSHPKPTLLVSNAASTGSVTGFANVGGLIGYVYSSTISKSFSISNVMGTADHAAIRIYPLYNLQPNYFIYPDPVNQNFGGLIGKATNTTVSHSFAQGTVMAEYSRNVGGLVGQFGGSGSSLTNSYATGNATGYDYVGGLIGLLIEGDLNNKVSIHNNYASGEPELRNTAEVHYLTTVMFPVYETIEEIHLIAGEYCGDLIAHQEGNAKSYDISGNVWSEHLLTTIDTYENENWNIATDSAWTTETWYIESGQTPKLGWQHPNNA